MKKIIVFALLIAMLAMSTVNCFAAEVSTVVTDLDLIYFDDFSDANKHNYDYAEHYIAEIDGQSLFLQSAGSDYTAYILPGAPELSGLTKATFVLKATPAVRFYIPEDADASSYEFFIDGVKLATEVGADADGKYIEMDVYAYLMSGTITYTVNGEAGGSYHVRSYYEYAKTLGDAKLVTLVERFASYCESAKAYRDMVNASV